AREHRYPTMWTQATTPEIPPFPAHRVPCRRRGSMSPSDSEGHYRRGGKCRSLPLLQGRGHVPVSGNFPTPTAPETRPQGERAETTHSRPMNLTEWREPPQRWRLHSRAAQLVATPSCWQPNTNPHATPQRTHQARCLHESNTDKHSHGIP